MEPNRTITHPSLEDRADRPGVNQYLLAMSHELKAPLNAVIGMSGLLLDGELSAKQRQYVKSIHGAGESLATILNDVLDLARMLAGRLVIEPIPFDLKSMVEETIKVLTPRAEDRGLALRVDWRPELARNVIGDPGRIRQVLANLIGHAVGSTSQGEVSVRVALEGEHEGVPLVRFTVEDTGIGLPPERLKRIFDQYVPVDASPYRSFGITGLGLRISAELVRCLGGEMGADSQLGRGSEFWFILPMPAADVAPSLINKPTEVGSGGRVLLIEPDHAARDRYGSQVDAAGWDLAYADEIDQAIERLREAASIGNPFNACVLSDYAVRPIHAELATRLKADEQLASVALVMLTAVGSPGEAKRLWHAGYAAYLRKPVPNDELKDTLAALEQVRGDGRGPALITRHSLAEARSAQAFSTEGIDDVLDGLTAPATRSALLIGTVGSDQIEITDTLAQVGFGITPVRSTGDALQLLTSEQYEFVLFDADHLGDGAFELLKSLHEQYRSDSPTPIIGLSSDAQVRQRLIEAAADEAIAKPVRRTDIEQIIKRWSEGGQAVAREAFGPVSGSMVESAEPSARIDVDPTTDEMTDDATEDANPSAQATLEAPPAETLGGDLSIDAVVSEPRAAIEATIEGPVQATEPAQPTEAAIASPLTDADGPEIGIAPIIETPVSSSEAVVEETAVTPVGGLITDDHGPSTSPVVDVAIEAPSGLVTPETPTVPHDSSEVDGFLGNGVGHLADAGAIEAVEWAPVGEVIQPESSANAEIIETHEPLVGTSGQAVLDLGVEVSDREEPQTDGDAADGEESTESPDPIQIQLIAPEGTGDQAVERGSEESAAPTESISLQPAIEASSSDPNPQANGTDTGTRDTEASTAVTEEREILPLIDGQLLDQIAQGGGFGLQHLVGTFIREAPTRIADLATSINRGDGARVEQAVDSLRQLAELIGAGRLVALATRVGSHAAGGDMERAAGLLGEIERAFLEIQETVGGAASPAFRGGMDLPAVSQGFLDQLAPEREGAARMLAVRMADSFKNDAPTRLAELKQAVERGDGETSQRLAQSLKGMCGLIQAEPMAKLCALVEADARLKRIGQSRRYLDQLSIELERVRVKLQ